MQMQWQFAFRGPQGNGLMMPVSWMPGISFTLFLLGLQTYQNNCGIYWFQNSPQCSEPNNVDGMCNERDAAASRLLLANSSSKVIGSPRLVKMRSPLLRENLCLFSRKHCMHRAQAKAFAWQSEVFFYSSPKTFLRHFVFLATLYWCS